MLVMVLIVLTILAIVVFLKKLEIDNPTQKGEDSSEGSVSSQTTVDCVQTTDLEGDDSNTITYANAGSISQNKEPKDKEGKSCDYILKPFDLLSVRDFYDYINSLERVGFEENYTVGKNISLGEYLIVSYEGLTCKVELFEPKKRKPFSSFCFSGYCIMDIQQDERIKISCGNLIRADEVKNLCVDTKVYTFKVGTHIESGKYKISQRDCTKFAVYYIWNNGILNFDDSVDSDAIWGNEVIDLKDGQYIYLENAVMKREAE